VEKITDAPATVTRIDADQIRMSVGNSFTAALKEIKGVDFFQTGIAAAGINARGFNSAFNNRMLQMEDNRIAVLPENGLPVGVFTTIPKVDIAGVEVLVGPGAALYGPDASNGVVTLLSKDPKQFQGTTLEMSVGGNSVSRFGEETPGTVSFRNIQGRHAGVALGGKLGYKVTGEVIDAYDWQNRNNYAPVAPSTQPSPELGADWNTDYQRAGGALVWYFDNGGRLEYQGGASRSNGIGITSAGRNQLRNWGYWNQQVRYASDRFFAQAYATRSLSGQTFALNGFSTNRLAPRFSGVSDDSVKQASGFPADGRLMAAEAQHNFFVPKLLNTRVVWGGQVRRDQVSSRRVWLEDAITGEDVVLQQVGVYAQTETPLSEQFKLVLGVRYDDPEFYDTQFSPKAALLWSPSDDHTFRATFNRAYKSPTILQTSFYFRDFAPFVGVFGNRDGIEVRNAAGVVQRTLAPVVPELNNTVEVGYKGVLKNRLFLEVAGWQARYESFLSPLVVVANPFAGTFAFNQRTGQKYTNAAGADQIALTYYNLGKATLSGIDAGWRFAITDNLSTSGTMSFLKLDSITQAPGDPPEATALNSPGSKFTLGLDARNLPFSTFGGVTVRHFKDYRFLSGVHNGTIPGWFGVDVNLGYRLPSQRAQINLSVQNAFGCTSGTTTAPAFLNAANQSVYTPGRECGFGREHIELLNMPALGAMAFLGVRFDF
jgi:iron complex outermembrane receptor protein